MKNSSKKTVMILIGTRPEAIKLAPVVKEIQSSALLKAVVCSTGQHREMLETALADFAVKTDLNLNVMSPNQNLAGLTSRLFSAIDEAVRQIQPDYIIVQGDTTTAMVGALCAFYAKIPLGHVEAGLRTGNLALPFPEELNRRVVSLAATMHFAPTEESAQNLLKEGIALEYINITGNTVVDALLYMKENVEKTPPVFPDELFPKQLHTVLDENKPYVLITGHRRESFGEGFANICRAISTLASRHPEYYFLYPVHLNPNVRDVVFEALSRHSNIMLLPPCSYPQFVTLLKDAKFILSDSGGIQEEAPSLGKEVLVMRDVTERPEGVKAGVCHLVGTDPEMIVEAAQKLIAAQTSKFRQTIKNPYGDGLAAKRIVLAVEQHLWKQ